MSIDLSTSVSVQLRKGPSKEGPEVLEFDSLYMYSCVVLVSAKNERLTFKDIDQLDVTLQPPLAFRRARPSLLKLGDSLCFLANGFVPRQ